MEHVATPREVEVSSYDIPSLWFLQFPIRADWSETSDLRGLIVESHEHVKSQITGDTDAHAYKRAVYACTCEHGLPLHFWFSLLFLSQVVLN